MGQVGSAHEMRGRRPRANVARLDLTHTSLLRAEEQTPTEGSEGFNARFELKSAGQEG